ncbi:hypothetical protein SB758_42990, partial [Burkholderia sp. SIMBA_013]
FAAGLLLAVAGCGVSSKPESAAGSSTQGALPQYEVQHADATMAKRAVHPMRLSAPMPAPISSRDSLVAGYRDEPRE